MVVQAALTVVLMHVLADVQMHVLADVVKERVPRDAIHRVRHAQPLVMDVVEHVQDARIVAKAVLHVAKNVRRHVLEGAAVHV